MWIPYAIRKIKKKFEKHKFYSASTSRAFEIVGIELKLSFQSFISLKLLFLSENKSKVAFKPVYVNKSSFFIVFDNLYSNYIQNYLNYICQMSFKYI